MLFNKLSYEAFRLVAWVGILPWVETHHPQHVVLINKAVEEDKELKTKTELVQKRSSLIYTLVYLHCRTIAFKNFSRYRVAVMTS